MAWQPKSDEAYEASNTFHVALALIGNAVYAALLALWARLVTPAPRRAPVTSTRWATSAETIINDGRKDAATLAHAFLMLSRALHTGFTFPPRGGGTAPETLGELRQAFTDAVMEFAPSALRTNVLPDPTPNDGHDDRVTVDPPNGTYRPYSPDRWGDDMHVGVEPIDGLDDMLDTLDEWSAKETHNVLDDLGVKRLQLKFAEIDKKVTLTPDELDAAREEASAIVGRGVSAHGERIVLNGGRQAEIAKGRRDSRVMGFVRIHFPEGDVNPCGFCALLISRGIDEIYSSKAAAKLKGSDFDEFHAGCHCRAIEVYSASLYETDAQYALNREYRKLWDSEFRDQYAGNNAAGIAAWRRRFRDRKAQARSQAA